jgi:hypothetical protein
MTEAEFERRQQGAGASMSASVEPAEQPPSNAGAPAEAEPSGRGSNSNGSRGRATRGKPAKPKRVQRMFALEEELDKKLWLYAIHVGKDRSEVVNDLLRPIVASMVLYDSRDRRAARAADPGMDRTQDGDSEG